MNLTEHLTDMRLTYATTDVTLQNHDYRIIFAEGDWTVAVAKVTGLQNGPLPNLDGTLLPPSGKQINMDLMTMARWNNGWMMEEYLWSDTPLMYRQLGVLPDKPAKDLPDLELNLATPLSTSNSSSSSNNNHHDTVASNKAAASRSDDAFNNGIFTLHSLNLSPNALIYGLSDLPMNPNEYISWLHGMKAAFPNLRLNNRPYRQIVAEGDWTATAAMLSGLHQGNLTLPKYLSGEAIPATGKAFSLLHYTIVRWQGGRIVGMRVNIDYFGIVAALGISL